MLLVTYSCNLRCTYCYEPKKVHKHMTVPDAKQYISEQVSKLDLGKFDEFEVQFMGGEPLLQFPLIREISNWLWRQTWPLHLAQVFAPTNGTLLNEEMKQWFASHRHQICLGLSFDGNQIMQNINRTGSFSSIDLCYFVKTWPNQSVKMTLSPQTLPFLYQGVTFLRENGFREIVVDLAMGSSIKWDSNHLQIWATQLRQLADECLKNPQFPPISLLDINVFNVLHKQSQPKKCGCGEQIVCVDTDGKEYACHLFAPITASDSLAMESQKINFAHYKDFESKVCSNCLLNPLCTTCYGMNFLTTGDITRQAPFTCQAFKIQFFIACEMYYLLAKRDNDTEKMSLLDKIVNSIESLENYSK